MGIIASGQITLADVTDGGQGEEGRGVSSIVEQYYLSTSDTTQTGGSWQTEMPTWESGKYVWTRSEITWINPSSVSYTEPILAKLLNQTVSSASEASEAANNAVVSSVTEYYLSTSATSQTGGSWSTTSPTWSEDTYVWTRTKTTTKSGTVSYSNAACVTGNTGAQGEQGIQGETGAKGDKGDKGDTGATGATGAGFQWNMLAKTNTSDLVFGGLTDNGKYDASEIVEDGIVIKRVKGTDKTEQATSWSCCYFYDNGKESLKEICSKAVDNPTITISMDARLNFDYSGNLRIGILTIDAKYTAYTFGMTGAKFTANVWGHVAVTCKATSTPTYKDNTIIYMSIISDSLKLAGNTMDIKNVKIEPGTTSTSWCTTQAETIGKDGSDGTSVSKTYTQYYLSASSTTQTGGSWSDTMPTWSSGKYIWQREITVLSTGSTVTGTAVLSNGLNSANQTASTANSNASSAVSTANTANTNASTAVSTANTAKSTADTANTTATEAKEIAEEVKGRHQIFAQDTEPTEATAGDIWFNTTEIQWDNVFYKPCTPYIKIKKSDGSEAFEQTAIARNYAESQSGERDIVYVGHDQIWGGTESKYYGMSTAGISAICSDSGNYEFTTDTLKSYRNELGGYWLNMYANGLRTKSDVPIDVPTVSADTTANMLQAVNLTYLKSYVTNAINSALTWKTLVQNKSCGSANKISFPTGTWHEIIILAKYHASEASTGSYDYVQATIPYAQWKYADSNYGTGTQVIMSGVVENPSDYVYKGHMSMSLRFAKSGTTWQLWVQRVYSHATDVTTSTLWDAYYR